jgi:hypothetical protein
MMRLLFAFLLLTFARGLSFAQGNNIHPYHGINPLKIDYSEVDAFALSLHNDPEKNPEVLAKKLTERFESKHEKMRAIFRWITDNIEYDTEVFCNKSQNAENQSPETVLRTRKAVCSGYSNLFARMYHAAVDSAIVVVGYSQQYAHDLNRKHEETDHAWNIIRLYEHWYLLDVTWASGYVRGGCVSDERFKHMENISWFKQYNDFWFLTPPEFFIFSHLPENKNFQLLRLPISMQEFKSIPIVSPNYFLNISSHYIRNPKHHREVEYNSVFNINKLKRIIEKETFRKTSYLNYYEMVTHHGILRAKAGTRMNFQIYAELPVGSVGLDFNEQNSPQSVNFKKTPLGISFEYEFKDKNLTYLTVFLNGASAITYLVLWQ